MEPKIKLNNNLGILLVEDSPTQLEQLQYSLEAHDYKVITAVNGKLGLEAARKHLPAIIISDIIMPEMNGYELCKAIRSDEILKDTPIVLLTSLSGSADVLEALKCGADNFIRKPYDERHLLLRIDNILSNRKLRSSDKVQIGVELYLGGSKHFITAERQQILDLLISTYEQAVELCGTLKTREQQISRTNDILRGIYQIAKGLNSTTSRHEVIEQVLDCALKLPDVRAGWFSVYKGDSNFKLAGSRGLPPALEVLGAMEGDCLCRRKVLAGEINRSMNITECERLKKAQGKTFGLSSHVTIPLKSGNQLMGILNLVSTNQILFNDDDHNLFNSIGNQIGAALDRCRIYEHLEELVTERTADLTAEIIARKKAEERVKKLNRIYAVLSSVNQAIVRIHDRDKFFNEVCTIAVKEGKFIMAWIGMVDPQTNKVNPVASAGFNENYLKTINIDLSDEKLSRGPTGWAIKLCTHYIANDIINNAEMIPWRENALRQGYKSLAVFLIKVFDKTIGSFNLYASDSHFFDEDEIKLLDELATDISFAIEFDEKETERKLAKQKSVSANKELVFQNEEKEKRAAELIIANKELVFQNEEKEKRATELIVAKDKAEEMSRLKSNFLANMSHELRTPLIGINGFADFLRQDIVDAELKEMAEIIFKSGSRLSETLNLILDLSKFESEKMDFNYQKIDLVIETEDVINLFKESAYKKGLYLKSSFSQPFIFINTDGRAVRSILNNLINNAIKFTVEGGITADTSVKDNFVEIKVIDTGIGISKENNQIIFEEFRQISEGLSRNFEGTGLGLNITKKLVDKLGGEISVESELGRGSEFIVKLPVTSIEEKFIEKIVIDKTEKKVLPIAKSVKPIALLIDDDPNVYMVLKRYLVGKFKLETIPEGEFGIELCMNKQYKCIFMDINLRRGMDGKQTTQSIRKIKGYENIPIVATTAYAMAGDKEEFLAAGCSHYLSKPFGQQDISNLLGELLKDS
ncbi:MAG: response regulator [Ignavibacteriaceae bacterium]